MSIKYLLSHWLFVILLSSHEFFNYSGYYTLFSCFFKYFHSFCRLAFHCLDSLLGREHLFINDFQMSFYVIFLTVLLGSYLINHCQSMVMKVQTYVYFQEFCRFVACNKFQIHFELDFCVWCEVRVKSNFILFHVDIHSSPHYLLKQLLFPH